MKIGTTTIPIAGWLVDARQVELSRQRRLESIRKIVEGYRLSIVELTLDLATIFPQVFDKSFYESAAKMQRELDFEYTVHLPSMWLDCSSLNESIRETSVENIRRAVDLVKPLHVNAYVLHLWGSTTVHIGSVLQISMERDAVLEAVLQKASRSLSEICEFIHPYNICVENLEAPGFNFIKPLIEQYNTSICLDIGHLAYQGGGEISFLDQHAQRIRVVHLHDAIREVAGGLSRTIDHLPLGRGEIDYRAFMQRLSDIDYKEYVTIENNRQNDLEQSIARIGDYL